MNLRSAEILRSLGSFQQSLSNVAYLSEMTPMCEKDGLQIGCAVKQELSNVLWERGELVPSIQILRNLVQNEDFESQSIPVGKAGLLATLVSRFHTFLRLEIDGSRANASPRPDWRSLRRY